MSADPIVESPHVKHDCGTRSPAGSGPVVEAGADAQVCVVVQEVDQHWQTFTVGELDDWFPGWRAIAFGQDAAEEARDDLVKAVTRGAGDASGLDRWTDFGFHLVGGTAASESDVDGSGASVAAQDRYARSMASMVLAELPVSLAEEWLCDCTELTDRIRRLAAVVCTAYDLDYAALGPAVVGAVVDHLCAYFPGLEPESPIKNLPRQPYCDTRTAWVINNVAEGFKHFRGGLIALLDRAAADFTVEGPAPVP